MEPAISRPASPPSKVQNSWAATERRTLEDLEKSKLTWYPADQPISLHRLRIGRAMLYATQHALKWPGEPSAIDVSLAVGPFAAPTTEDFGYYPTYARLNPAQRRCYLEWLAAGRQDEKPATRSLGYVFLFFYGIERRILLDGDRAPSLIEEVIRLYQHYGPAHQSRSLRSYFLQLLHFAGWLQGTEAYRGLWPRLMEFDGERPDEDGLPFVLANLYRRGERLDWTVAYRLALADELSRRSIVAKRARAELWSLFERRYRDEYPEGLALEATKQLLSVPYQPASGALMEVGYQIARRGANPLEVKIPNVIGAKHQFQKLPQIWNSCIEDLAGYSRAIAGKRYGNAAAVSIWQSLPPELRRIEDHPLHAAWRDLIDAAPKEDGFVFCRVGSMAEIADISERARLTLGQSQRVAALARDFGWEVAPSPTATGISLAWDQEVVLYPSVPGEAVSELPAGPVRLLYLCVTLAASDGVVDPQRLGAFDWLMAAHENSPAVERMLRSTEAALWRDTNVAIRALQQIARSVPPESRSAVLHAMVQLAAADGEISLDELRVLQRIARAFELDPGTPEALMREKAPFREVVIRTGEIGAAKGEAIPPRRIASSGSFALDSTRIAALTQETNEVIAILSKVMEDGGAAQFEGDDLPSPLPEPFRPPIDNTGWMSGLDSRYQPVLRQLLQSDVLTISEFNDLAAQHHLLPEDVFNAINDWADQALGDFLMEQGNDIRIYRNLLSTSQLKQLKE